MADIKNEYGTTAQTITVTLASLGSGSARESTNVDNATNNFVDALVGGTITTGTSPTVDTTVDVYAYGTVDDGTTYSGDATGTDAAYTGRTENLIYLGSISVSASSDTGYQFGPFSIAGAFGGNLPENWGLVFVNNTDAALNSTAGNHNIDYQGVYATST